MNQLLRLPAEICFMMKMENMSEPRKRYEEKMERSEKAAVL